MSQLLNFVYLFLVSVELSLLCRLASWLRIAALCQGVAGFSLQGSLVAEQFLGPLGPVVVGPDSRAQALNSCHIRLIAPWH